MQEIGLRAWAKRKRTQPLAGVADRQDVADLGEGEAGGLSLPDQREPHRCSHHGLNRSSRRRGLPSWLWLRHLAWGKFSAIELPEFAQ
jgi:hypothetical protein